MHTLEEISDEMRSAMRTMNAYLMSVEEAIVTKAMAFDASLLLELEAKKEGMDDYELDVEIAFFNDHFDDPLFEMNTSMKHISLRKNGFLLHDGEDHNEYTFYPHHPMRNEFFCYTLHALCAHAHLEWDEILSLSFIHWEVIPRYQYTQKISTYYRHTPLTKRKEIPIIYDKEHYDFYLPSVIEEHLKQNGYPIDFRKYERIARDLSFEYAWPHRTILPLEEYELSIYHTLEYLLSIRSNKHTIATITRISLLESIPASMSNAYLINPIRAMTRGTIIAALSALEYGWAIHLGGGFHHANKERGGGFSFFNDYALATLRLRELYPEFKILYIDLDAHIGDGVIAFAKSDPNFWVFDMYGAVESVFEKGFDVRTTKGEKITLVALNTTIKDALYLTLLKNHLTKVIDAINPDFIFYNAGSDILKGDKLGMMEISIEGMIKRDRFVFTCAKERKIPICMCLSGGYGYENHSAVVESLQGIITLMRESKD